MKTQPSFWGLFYENNNPAFSLQKPASCNFYGLWKLPIEVETKEKATQLIYMRARVLGFTQYTIGWGIYPKIEILTTIQEVATLKKPAEQQKMKKKRNTPFNCR